jgi:hypothetical protein
VTDAARLAQVVHEALLSTIAERAVAPGIVTDVARRIAHQAIEGGVPAEDVLELAQFGSRS